MSHITDFNRSTCIPLNDLPSDMRIVFRRNQIRFQFEASESMTFVQFTKDLDAYMEKNITGLWSLDTESEYFNDTVSQVTMCFEHREDLELVVTNFLMVHKLSN